MTESCPVEITFDTDQEMAGLEVIAGLKAAYEFGEPAIEIVARNIQVAAGPCSPEVRPQITSRPVVRQRGSGRRIWRHVRCMRRAAHADRNKRDACETYILHDASECGKGQEYRLP